MNKIIPFITTANNNLQKQEEMILRAVKTAEEYTFSRLNIDWDVNVVITNRLYNIVISEDGVGGRTYTGDFITLGIDEKTTTEGNISEMLSHELCHAARWGKNAEWIKCLFDGMINEGIATYFEAELAKTRDEKQFFIKTIMNRSDRENEKILEFLKGQLDSREYDYNMIFYTGNEKLPRWSGYSVGYYLVKKYLEKTGKKIEDAFTDNYDDFRVIL